MKGTPETVIGIHLELTDADKTQLETWLQNMASLDLKTLLTLLDRAISYKITLITPHIVATLTETVVYP